MRHRRATKTERLTLAVEPQLRARIDAEASRRHMPISTIVRMMLRDQLDAMSGGVDRAAA
jgi:hypothetical protein